MFQKLKSYIIFILCLNQRNLFLGAPSPFCKDGYFIFIDTIYKTGFLFPTMTVFGGQGRSDWTHCGCSMKALQCTPRIVANITVEIFTLLIVVEGHSCAKLTLHRCCCSELDSSDKLLLTQKINTRKVVNKFAVTYFVSSQC